MRLKNKRPNITDQDLHIGITSDALRAAQWLDRSLTTAKDVLRLAEAHDRMADAYELCATTARPGIPRAERALYVRFATIQRGGARQIRALVVEAWTRFLKEQRTARFTFHIAAPTPAPIVRVRGGRATVRRAR